MNTHSLPNISIYDGEDLIEISFDDLLKYHGHNMIGGVALAYRIMLWTFPKLSDSIPVRGSFSFLSGIGPNGLGVIDSVEMVLRVKTNGTLETDLSLVQDKPAPKTPGKGRYYFEISYQGRKIALALKDNLVPEEFYHYSALAHEYKDKNQELPADIASALRQARHNVAETILQANDEDLFVLV